jgi:hypothetical protein
MSASGVSGPMQPYYKEDFTLLDPSMTQTNRYIVYGVMAAILILLLWLLWGKYGKKLSRKNSVSMFY